MKRLTKKPVCVGFGVSNPSQAKSISQVADGVIVGSAIVKVIARNLGKKKMIPRVVNFIRRLREAI